MGIGSVLPPVWGPGMKFSLSSFMARTSPAAPSQELPKGLFNAAFFHLTALRNRGCPNRSVSVLSEAAYQSVEIILCYLLV